jgi:DNA invertase Pin-like site-specific DNA recombinase
VAKGKKSKRDLATEEQLATLTRFIEVEGCQAVGEFIEIETSKGADSLDRRPQLAAAIGTARKRKGAVLVATLDRLSRDVHFILALMAQRVPIIVADLDRRDGLSSAAPELRRSFGRLKRPARPVIEQSKLH